LRAASAVLVELDPEESYKSENKTDYEQQHAAEYKPDEALLFGRGVGDSEGRHKRFHQKVENAIHHVLQSLLAEHG
jgi:hypothetical protein